MKKKWPDCAEGSPSNKTESLNPQQTREGLRDNCGCPTKALTWIQSSISEGTVDQLSTDGAHPTQCVVMMNCVRQDIETNGGY